MRLNAASVLKVLRVASAIIPKLPASGDSPLTIAVKLLGIADSAREVTKSGSNAALHDFFEGQDATVHTNEHLVSCFFGTDLQCVFTVSRLSMSDYCDVVRAHHPVLGTLWFVEWRYGARPEPSNDFWASRGFDFAGALEQLWELYSGRIHIALVERERGVRRSEYSAIPRCTDPLLGAGPDMLDRIVAKRRRYARDEVSVTYLFVGAQGTGKSTFAVRMAEVLGERVLRLDAASFTSSGLRDLDLVLEGLQPGMLIVDDIDRADLWSSLGTMLTTLTTLKAKRPALTIVLTVNHENRLDPAMLRPGRIDEIVDFEPPSADDRRQLLFQYARGAGADPVTLTVAELDQLVAATEGMGAAYLRHFAIQLRYEAVSEVLAMVERRRRLEIAASQDVTGDAPKAAAPAPS